MPHDGSASASLVNVGDINYMKAYQDTSGTYTYINDNIIDNRNLRPVNFNTIGGTATPTKQIRLGANLPASDPIFDSREPEAGGRQALAVLVYDSLGNSHNINFQYTKESSNAWSLDSQMPEGAATMIVYDDRETTVDISDDVYSARGQLEFSKIPDNHTSIKITDDVGGGADEATYIFEFSTDGTTSTVPATGETVVMVDISTGVVSINDAMDHFHTAITANVPAGNRFTVVNNRIAVEQSITGSPLFFDTSSCLQCLQSSANPNLTTGLPSGAFTVPEIDWELKNGGRIDLESTLAADYAGNTMCIGNKIYEFTDGAPLIDPKNIEVSITTAKTGLVVDREAIITLLDAAITLNGTEPTRFNKSGTSLDIEQSESGGNIMLNTLDSTRINFNTLDKADYIGDTLALGGVTYEFTLGGGVVAPIIEVDLTTLPVGADATTPVGVVNLLKAAIAANDTSPSRYVADGASIFTSDILADDATCFTEGGAGAVAMTIVPSSGIETAVPGAVSGELKSDGATASTTIAGGAQVIGDAFTFNGEANGEAGSKAPAIRFNSDGTPKYFNIDSMEIEWANGAQNMNGQQDGGSLIDLFMGNVNTPDGLTHLAGEFIPNYISQDGAKFGNYAGVTIGSDGIITALFDNGETRPVAQIPLATFVNPNGMESLSGNAWIETDYSGQPTLRQAGDGGAGSINASSLESSTVDLGEEFTAMITTQRAYSAAAKIITTTDAMLEELMRVKR